MSTTTAGRLFELYRGREEFFAEGYKTTDEDGEIKVAYRPVERALTVADLERHLAGKSVVGVYHLRRDSTVLFASSDLDDPEHPESTLMRARKLRRTAVEMGFPNQAMLVSFSGRKGHHVDFFFSEPIAAATARLLLQAINEKAGFYEGKVELFPKQDHIDPDEVDEDGRRKLGNLIKLPLGLHPLTGKLAEFVDPQPVIPAPADAVLTVLGAHEPSANGQMPGRLTQLFGDREPGFRVKKGERHDYWTWRASRLRNAGLTGDEIFAVLQREGRERFEEYQATQADEDHLRQIVNWFAARPIGEAMVKDYMRAQQQAMWEEEPDPAAAPPANELPAFPVDVLPDPARRYVEKLAEGGLPLDFLGPYALSIMAAAIGGLVELQLVAGSWMEPLILWYAMIGLPGTGKTPAAQALRSPLDAIEKPWRETYRLEMAKWRRLTPTERKEQPKPKSQRLLIGNSTLEKLIRLLEPDVNAPGMVLIADEIRSTISGLGQYKRGGGSDRADFLSLWSATPISYDRVHDEIEIYVARPVVTIAGGLQPHLLHVLDGDDGLRDRFCLSWYAASPSPDPPALNRADQEERGWTQLIYRLASKRHISRVRAIAPAAKQRFQAAQKRLRKIQISSSSPAHLSSWASKGPSHLARHALLLSEAAGAGIVDEDSMEQAEQIVRYFVQHCQALPIKGPNLMAKPYERGKDEAVDRLEDHVRRQPSYCSARRDLQRARVAGVRTAEDLNALIERYSQTYPGCVVREVVSGGAPSERVLVYAPGHQPQKGV